MILGALLFVLAAGRLNSAETPLPALSAAGAIVIDRDTGLVLGIKDPDTPLPMASTTKIMTGLIAVERANLPASDPNHLRLDALVGPISARAASRCGSRMGLGTNDVVSLLDLLYGAMLESGNDAATAIAEHIAGNETDFATLMSSRAEDLVLTNTHFQNASGFDDATQYASARDLAALARVALTNALFAKLVSTPFHRTTSWVDARGEPRTNWTEIALNCDGELLAKTNSRQSTLYNQNLLVRQTSYHYRYPGADGVKPGMTGQARYCEVASAGVPGKGLVSVNLGSTNQFPPAIFLLDFGFEALFDRVHPTSLAHGFFNDDAYEDLAIGMPYEEVDGIPAAGKVMVLMGTAAGLDTNDPIFFTQSTPGIYGVPEWGDYFGFALAVGDFDGNGRDDLAIGVPFEDLGSIVDAGVVHIIYSDANGLNPRFPSQTFAQNDQGDGDLPGTAQPGDLFGFSLAAGNFDNTYGDDLAIGVPEKDIAVPSAVDGGAVVVLYSGGSAVGLRADLHPQVFDQSNPSEVPGTAEDGDRFGFALAAGDFDGNGYADLAIGAPFEDLSGSTDAGHVSILYGHAGGLDPAWKTNQINQPVANGLSAAEPGDHFGFALAVGDFDNNGRADLAIGAPGEAVGSRVRAGAVDVIYSDATGLNPAFRAQEFYQDSANMPGTSEAGDLFGAALATGDFDNSRPNYVRDDLAIGIPGEDIVVGGRTLTNVGAVTVLYSSGTTGLVAGATTDLLLPPNPVGLTVEKGPGEHFGLVLAAGRFDAGNTEDLAWGGWGQHYDQTRLRSGYTLLTYSGGLSGLDTNTTVGTDVWLRDPCDDEPLPLRFNVTANPNTSRIWNRLDGTNRVWNYESRDYRVSSPMEYPTNYSLSLNHALNSDHFRLYYTDSGTNAADRANVELMAGLLEEGWDAFFGVQGFLSPRDLQWEERYSLFEPFNRIPVWIFTDPVDQANHASTRPSILLRPNLSATNESPIHELFHVVRVGYTAYGGYKVYNKGWLNEGLARWSQKFKPGHVPGRCDSRSYYESFSAITNSLLSMDYCDSARFFEYLGQKYSAFPNDSDSTQPMNGSDVVRAILEELREVGSTDDFEAMQAIERALDRFSISRPSGFGNAFAEWAVGNYLNDNLLIPTIRPDAPTESQYLEAGNVAPGGNEYPWRAYSFDMPTSGTLTISVCASATNYPSGGDDDLRFKLDDVVIADWNSPGAFNGAALRGSTVTNQMIVPNVAAGHHTLQLEADAHPVLYDITVSLGTTPLLEVRTGELNDWSAHYHVVPVTQALINSGESVKLDFNSVLWNNDMSPPFSVVLYVNDDGTGIPGSRTQGFGRSWTVTPASLQYQGAGGRLVFMLAGIDWGGTYELVVTYPPDTNDPPVLPFIANQTIPEGKPLSLNITAADPDLPANHLTYTLNVGAPAGASIDPRTGLFTWTPSETQGGGVYDLTVRVTDDGNPSLADTATFRVTVTEDNKPPRVDPIADRAVQEGEAVSLAVVASDPDVPLNTLSFALGPNAPGGMTLNPQTGWLQWTPNETQGPGTYRITLQVTDNGIPNLSASNVFTVTVAEVNQAPSLAALADRTVHAGTALSFPVAATDSDLPPNTLSFRLVDSPAGASIDSLTGHLLWTPADGQAGASYPFTVEVVDDGEPSLSDTRTFSVTVATRPVITAAQLVGESLRLTWTSLPGQRYRLQYQSELGIGPWTDLPSEVLATADSTTAEDAPGMATRRFYRVQVLP